MKSKYIKPKLYKGGSLKGEWEFTIKLDGVRAFWTKDGVVSRANKPLLHLPEMPLGTDAEVFLKDFSTTISAIRTHSGEDLPKECVHSLYPLDKRLKLGDIDNPSEKFIAKELATVLAQGHEGLVLRQGNRWLKVKPEETLDLVVTGWEEGKGKNMGKLGSVHTSKGKVGTGFTNKDREQLFTSLKVGGVMEVSCMEFTEKGKMRHPRFIRMRPDKETPNAK